MDYASKLVNDSMPKIDKIKRVTLFWPFSNYTLQDKILTPSSTMAYLSSVLESKNFEVTVVDARTIYSTEDLYKNPNKTLEDFVKIIEKTDPDLLGIGSWTVSMPFIAKFVPKFKETNPNVPIVVGGYNPTFLPKETLELIPQIDFLARGEGEFLLLDLIQTLNAKKNINKVKGISFWKNRKIVNTPNGELIKNLDKIPIIDFENFLQIKKWKIHINYFNVMSSRGCQYNCGFCSVRKMWPKTRYFSIPYMIKQIKHLNDLYGLTEIPFGDDNFMVNIARTKKLTKEIHKKFKYMKLKASVRLESISTQLISEFKKYGLNWFAIGVESIIPESLKFFNKTQNPEQYVKLIYKAMEILKKANLDHVSLHFIIGAPNETKEDIIKLINFSRLIKEKYNFFPNLYLIALLPGTDLWNLYVNKKIEIYKVESPIKNFNYPFVKDYSFVKDYNHLVWMVPTSYRIKNNNMPIEEFENLLRENNVNELM
jgi:radical SAM superfamily enzyme YgiQ (UPF0313 family)